MLQQCRIAKKDANLSKKTEKSDAIQYKNSLSYQNNVLSSDSSGNNNYTAQSCLTMSTTNQGAENNS